MPRLPHPADPDGGPPAAAHPLRIVHRLPRQLLRRRGIQGLQGTRRGGMVQGLEEPLGGNANPKSEARNSKQIQRTKIRSTKSRGAPARFVLSALDFGFVSNFVLRISDLPAASYHSSPQVCPLRPLNLRLLVVSTWTTRPPACRSRAR